MMPAWSVENVRQGDPCGAGLGAGIALNFIAEANGALVAVVPPGADSGCAKKLKN
jgi:hypothetical protein